MITDVQRYTSSANSFANIPHFSFRIPHLELR
jgi:hypothetical protein